MCTYHFALTRRSRGVLVHHTQIIYVLVIGAPPCMCQDTHSESKRQKGHIRKVP